MWKPCAKKSSQTSNLSDHSKQLMNTAEYIILSSFEMLEANLAAINRLSELQLSATRDAVSRLREASDLGQQHSALPWGSPASACWRDLVAILSALNESMNHESVMLQEDNKKRLLAMSDRIESCLTADAERFLLVSRNYLAAPAIPMPVHKLFLLGEQEGRIRRRSRKRR